MLLKVQFSESTVGVNVKFSSDSMRVDTAFADLQKVTIREDALPYTGAYDITPRIDEQTLPTAQKLMTEDLKVKAIPYFETSNASDGETVYIGSEV